MITTIIISALSGGLAGSVATNWFTIWRDKFNRKRTFRGYIKSVKAELLAIDLTAKDHKLVERYEATISGVRRACCDVSDDIVSPDFEKAWVHYCGLTEPDMAQREGDTNRQLLIDHTIQAFAPHYEQGRDKAIKILDTLIGYPDRLCRGIK